MQPLSRNEIETGMFKQTDISISYKLIEDTDLQPTHHLTRHRLCFVAQARNEDWYFANVIYNKK